MDSSLTRTRNPQELTYDVSLSHLVHLDVPGSCGPWPQLRDGEMKRDPSLMTGRSPPAESKPRKDAIILAAIVVPTLTQKTNSSQHRFTSFAPNDSYLYPMPDYGKDPLFKNYTILREVYQAHLIENEAVFLPGELESIPEKKALFGSIRFYRRRGKLYISNNRVHARVVQANIATANGVIHIIDNLLHYIYHNALQMAGSMVDTKLFAQLLQGLSEEEKTALTNTSVTLFVPSDWAFSKVPLYWQAAMVGRGAAQIDSSPLEEVVFRHVVPDSSLDSSQLYDGQKLTTANNRTLTVLTIEGDFYLETGDGKVRARLDVVDVGVTNGVVHVLTNILYADGFTVWDAVSDIPELSRIHDVLSSSFHEMRAILSSEDGQPITAFLPRNQVIERASDHLNTLLLTNPAVLLKALKGHVIGQRLSSTQVVGETTHITLSGQTIKVIRTQGSTQMSVVGGHVTSTVVVKDVFCSNGVLYIIDDLIHTATRTVGAELEARNELRYMQTLFFALQSEMEIDLTSKNDNFTVFVPHNDAFSSLPWDTVDKILQEIEWSKEVLKAHVIAGEVRTLDQLDSSSDLKSENGIVHVLREDEKVYVVNNNIRAAVIMANIPAVNGWIHVIDHLLTIPYISVRDLMTSREDLQVFHQLLSPLAEYQELMASPLRQVTLFIPSSRYINSLTPSQMARVRNNNDILRKLFHGHVIPNVRLDDMFLAQYPDQDYTSRNSFNVSFTISRGDTGMYVGVGFDILPLDPIGRATGCTDGVIYVIDGFLNYSPFSVLERLKREPGLSGSFELMSRLVNANEINLLDDPDLVFTFLMPDDLALDYFTIRELLWLHSLPELDRQQTFWRHSINGSALYYDDFRNGRVTNDAFPPEVSVDVSDEAVYLEYRQVTSKVKQWNLIASNGVIHILNRYLYDDDTQYTQADALSTTIPGPGGSPTARDPAALQAGVTLKGSPLLLLALQVVAGLSLRVLLASRSVR